MPVIRNSADLTSNFLEISNLCHKFREPVFLTSNGEGDLAIMSIETYEEMAGCNELYKLIQEGTNDLENGRTFTEKEVIRNMQLALGK